MPKVVYNSKKGLVQESGTGVEVGGNTLVGGLSKVFSVNTGGVANAGDLTLTAADSGCIISLVDTSGGGAAIVLPTATTAGAGFTCDICYAANTPGGNTTVTGGTFKLINVDGGAATEDPDSGTTLTLATSGGTAGDRVRIICDGVLYYVMGASSAGTNITAA